MLNAFPLSVRAFPGLLAGAAVAVLTAAPLSAAEYMHCFLREAPDDAPASSEYDVSALAPALPTASVKHARGLATEADVAMLETIVADGGCAPDSEIAAFLRETFEPSPEASLAALEAQSSEAVMARVFTAVEICAAGEAGYDADCGAAVRAAMEAG
jgi:hypothetical protein